MSLVCGVLHQKKKKRRGKKSKIEDHSRDIQKNQNKNILSMNGIQQT